MVSHGTQTITVPKVLDRKSTRLNSSHLGISYAVFCLKKQMMTFLIFARRSCQWDARVLKKPLQTRNGLPKAITMRITFFFKGTGNRQQKPFITTGRSSD